MTRIHCVTILFLIKWPVNLKWIKDSTIMPEIVKLLGKKPGENIHDISLGNEIFI